MSAPEGLPDPADRATKTMKVGAPFPETRLEEPAPRPPRTRQWLFGLLAVVLLGGAVGVYFLGFGGEGGFALRAPEVPPPVRPYLDLAKEGDPSAMRMLGTMYYNGLNVRQDRREGIRWFRKAAKAGSVAAKRDLEQLGLTVEGP
ncbi:tetratricopeptide repeat protein [Mesoterricola sediminis]|uniref:Sel1 repeat family protein n=1 Tax=Mesoterricola sediminis TaxID=2927980 RepID=A0AA48KCZ9_9BACT|nr:hypothetical protein [Mesoterricola sediminis]BDU77661.1 hypothetical protein METESE_26190 [Mesoterricola sediminis]